MVVPHKYPLVERAANDCWADTIEMVSMAPDPDDYTRRIESLPPLDENAAAVFLQEEAATYSEVGEFYFRNPSDLGTRVLVNWFNDVAQSVPARRWGTLEMLALYGLAAAESTGRLPLTEQQEAELVASIATDGPIKAELEHAARDAISLLQSGADPTAELPADWALYRHALPDAFRTVCLVLAVLTLETAREAAVQEQLDPATMWKDWLASRAGE